MTYIQSEKNDNGCVFCHAPAHVDGPENLIIQRGEQAFVILNRYPYTSGHLMVVPFEHRQSLEEFSAATRAEMMELISQCLIVLKQIYHAEGFNIGANLGSAAGAGIPTHCHLHIVPRWTGDTNFMSAIGETRVVPEAIETSYQRIRQAWESQK